MTLFISFDTVFGIYAAVKKGGWKAFTSNKLFNVVIKSFFYLMCIILAFCVDSFLLDGETIMGIKLFFAKSITCLFLYIELKSIDETSVKLGNRSIWVIMKEMLGKLKSIKKDLNEVVSKDDQEQ